jgi:Reverse transcriptase (RNA-dependent DNA polymerase)
MSEQINTNKRLLANISDKYKTLAKKFFHHIHQSPVEMGDDIITLEDWSKKLKKWKERTTTSPSGLHLGHHKALLSPHSYSFEDNSKDKAELDHKQSMILTAFLTLLNISIQSTIPLERWKTVHSVALFKDAHNRYVHRIRNIHIYEADYNFILKHKWEQAIALAEHHNTLHPSQYGSRKHRRSIDPVFLEIMQQEISRFTKTPYIQINYDAQACYDCIIPDIAFTVSRKHGVHPKILHIVQTMMKNSKYYIKLGTHITEKKYGNTDSNAIYGTGQGSGCSPHIWTLISSELFHIYMEESQSFRITEPYNGATSQMHVTAYVDHVNTHHSFAEGMSTSHMIQTATMSAQ